MTNRRTFVRKGLGVFAALSLPVIPTKASPSSKYKPKLGVAGYSFVNFNLDDSLKMMKRMQIHYLCIKDFHLPLKSTEAEIAAFHKKLADADVKGYAVGPLYMTKSLEEIDNAFEYAKRVGVDLIIGIPRKEDLAYISGKADEYGIRYAIHNHGPEDKLYPNSTVIYDLIKNLSPKMGICFDMGHNARDGHDSVKDLKRYSTRIFDIHLKNITESAGTGKTTELSRGVIDIPAFVKVLKSVQYPGVCSLEFEKDMNDPLAGIAESAGYFRGVVDAICQ
ncbi:sugar phosphate isomerase/epimerase family protein [Leadbetterella sp. DM7]|uniref:sugar phosphate isomerase/epimerase family protein n=1 Tax=Leadbetterella sp. DM7 TaxID=3235085 RepID=UPI00349E8644